MVICKGPVRKNGTAVGVSNRKDLIEGLDDRDEGEVVSPTGDDEAIQRLAITRSRSHP